MSEVVRLKVSVELKDLETLRSVLLSLGKPVDAVCNFFGRPFKNVLFGVKTEEIERGVGVVKEGDHYVLVCDDFGIRTQVQEFLDEVIVRYKAELVKKAAMRQGYKVSTSVKGKGKDVLVVVNAWK